jgi:RimJ/RimL family protein N-acetyltransferase
MYVTKLLPIDTAQRLDLAARWFADESNYQWFDFGGGRQIITLPALQMMLQRPTNYIRLHTDELGRPIGIAALTDVNRHLRTATFWGITGEKSFRSRGYATLSGSLLLTHAFGELGLNAVNTWLVDTNPSRKVLERLNFRYVGRMRQCHMLGGQMHDRLFYDILASEHRELRPDEVQRFTERRGREHEREQEPPAPGDARRAQ